jgi:hypothetical protein
MSSNREARLFYVWRCPEHAVVLVAESPDYYGDTCPVLRPAPCGGDLERIEVIEASKAEAEREELRRALAAAQPKVEWQAQIMELQAEVERLREALQELAEWGANRAQRSAASDLNQDEERGWNLALGGLEHRARQALAEGGKGDG